MKQSGELNRRKDITVNKDQPSAASLDTLDSLVGCQHGNAEPMPFDPDDLWCPDCGVIFQTPNDMLTVSGGRKGE